MITIRNPKAVQLPRATITASRSRATSARSTSRGSWLMQLQYDVFWVFVMSPTEKYCLAQLFVSR